MGHPNRLVVTAVVIALGVTGPATSVTAAVAPTGSVPAGAAVPAGFDSWAELLTMQEQMNDAAGRITAAATADAGSGYAGAVADPRTRELRIYWKGTAPANLVATARAAVPIRVLPAAYTSKELLAASARLLGRAGAAVTRVGPRPDGSGLLVGTAGEVIPAAAWAGVPVTVTTVTPVAATRVDDAAPWSGGARWTNATRGGSCSTGFGVRVGAANRVLTAAHCAAAGNVANDPTGELIGSVTNDVNASDVQLIGATSQGRIYNNTVTPTGGVGTEFTNPVVGSRTSVVGNAVCTSGSFSGTRCDLRVAAINQCIRLVGGAEAEVVVCGEVEANHTAGGNAAGAGDSGGAVMTTNAADTTQVFARGTITAIDQANRPAPCTGYVPTGRTCSSAVFYQDITSGLAAVGASGVVLG